MRVLALALLLAPAAALPARPTRGRALEDGFECDGDILSLPEVQDEFIRLTLRPSAALLKLEEPPPPKEFRVLLERVLELPSAAAGQLRVCVSNKPLSADTPLIVTATHYPTSSDEADLLNPLARLAALSRDKLEARLGNDYRVQGVDGELAARLDLKCDQPAVVEVPLASRFRRVPPYVDEGGRPGNGQGRGNP